MSEKPETINHPKHYTSHPSGVEAIELCELLGFNVGNAIKYLFRADHKNAKIDDLKKAAWYLRRAVAKDSTYYFDMKAPALQAVLDFEPDGAVLGDVLRALRLTDTDVKRVGRLSLALLRVEREAAERERDVWRSLAEGK